MDLSQLAGKHFADTFELLFGEGLDDETDPMEHAKAWHEMLVKPMDSKDAKWVKACTRILGHPPPRYFAVEYKDSQSLSDLYKEFGADPPKDGSKERYWSGMKMLCRHAMESVGYEPVKVPTPQEIQENIQKHRTMKQAKSSPMSMTTAFQTGLSTLGDHIGGEEGLGLARRIRAMEKEELKEACDTWSNGIEEGLEAKLKARDLSLIHYEWPVLTDLEKKALSSKMENELDDTWSDLEQAVCFSRVQKSIPTGMLSKIEECAQSLARDISSGKTSLESIDLQKLGEGVLSQCSEEDMNKMAGNIGSLLPSIGTLQGALQK